MGKAIAILVILAVILISSLIYFYKSESPAQTGQAVDENLKEFTLEATRFVYSPDTIEVNKGDKVRININNVDTMHGIRIPAFGIKDEYSIEFTANQTGEFDFFCTVFCGDQHREMRGKLIIK